MSLLSKVGGVLVRLLLLAIALIVGSLMFYEPKAHAAESVCSRGDILLCEDFESWNFTGGTAPTCGSFLVQATGAEWSTRGWILGQALTDFPCNNVYRETASGATTYGANGSHSALQIRYNSTNWGAVQYPDKQFSGVCAIQQECYMRLYIKFSTNFLFNATTDYGVGKIFYFADRNAGFYIEMGDTSRHTKWDVYNYASSACPLNSTGTVDNTKGKPAFDMRGTSTSAHARQTYQAFSFNEETGTCLFAVQPDPRPIFYFDRSGTWHSWEVMAKVNSLGATNGALKMWMDGRLIIDQSNLMLHTSPHTINAIWIAPYMGCGVAPNCTQSQTLWIDNIVASTHYIGPIAGTVLPFLSPPTGVRVQ